jgi:hypothetical protein
MQNLAWPIFNRNSTFMLSKRSLCDQVKEFSPTATVSAHIIATVDH